MASFVDQLIANAVKPINAVTNSPQVREAQAQGYQQGAAQDVNLPGPPVIGPDNLSGFIAQGAGQGQYLEDNRAGNYRTNGQRVGDMLNSAVTGLMTTPLEMGNIPLQAVSPTAGAAVTRFIQSGEDNANSKKSDALHDEERAWQARNNLTADYHHAQKQDDIANGDSELVASLKQVGRDFISSVANSNSDIIGDQTANATGALLTAGPMEAGLGIAGKAALRTGMDLGLVGSRAAARTAIRTGEKLAMPAILGGQQAAGIDQSTASNILTMSPEELAANSQSYRDGINAGLSDEDARNLVARNAGLTAGAMSFPLAAAAGELRVPLAKAPFAPGSVGEAIGNVLKSGVDGAVFGADGTLAANAANKMYANPNQEMTDGLGDSMAQGSIMGLAMAGATQAPGLAGKAAMLPVDAVKAVGRAVVDRGAAKQAGLDAKTRELLNGKQDALVQAMKDPAFAQQVNDALGQIQDPTERQAKTDYVQNIMKAATLQPEDTQSPFPTIQKALDGATDKFDAFRRIAGVASDENASPEDKLSAGLTLIDHFNRNGDILRSPSRALGPLPEDHPAVEHLRQLEGVLADAEQHPDVQKAIKDAMQYRIDPESLDLSTDKGKQNVENAIGIAMHTPESGGEDPAVPNKVLSLADKGDIKLTKAERSALEVQAGQLEAEQQRQAQAKKMGLDTRSVSNEITTESGNKGPSLREHVANVVKAMNAGNLDLAKERMAGFHNFAEHMSNKVQAFNTHFETKNGNTQDKIPFQAYKRGTDEWYTSHQFAAKPTKKEGVVYARHLDLDAQSVVTHHNLLAHAYPELGIKEMKQPEVNKELTKGSVRDVMKTFRQRAAEGKPQYDAPKASNESAKSAEKPTEKAVSEPHAGDQPVEKTDNAQVKGENAESSSSPKAPTEEKVPPTSKDLKTLRSDHTRERDEKLRKTTKSGQLQVVDSYPENIRPSQEEGKKTFFYKSRDGRKTVAGSYVVEGDTIHSLDIGNKNNFESLKNKLGAGDVLNIGKQLIDQNPGVKSVEGLRTSGAKTEGERAVTYDVKGKRLILRGNDAVPSSEPTEAKTETETPPSGTDTETPASPEAAKLSVGDSEQGANTPIAKRYPTLFSNVAKGITNWFAKGFTTPKEPKSRLVTTDDPYEHVFETIDSQKKIEAFIDQDLGRKLTAEASESYQGLLKQGMLAYKHMKDRLTAELNEKLKSGETLQDAMLNGRGDKTAVNALKELKVLNLTELDEKGNLVYNEHLLQSALLAGMHWLVTSAQSGRVYDEESLAKMLNIDTFEAGKYLSWFNEGNYTADGVQSLTNTIERFWGVNEKKDTPQGLNRGISEGMAKEVILGLKKSGLLKEGEQNDSQYRMGTLYVPENGKNYSRLVARIPEKVQEGIKSFPDLIEHIVLVDRQPLNHVGKAPTEVDKFQMGGDKQIKIKPQQVETIENNQETPYYLERNTFGSMLNLGRDRFVKTFGYDLNNADLNINDRKALESFNQTVSAAWDYVTGIHSELKAVSAAQDGKDIHDIPIHYEFKMSRVNRLHAQGRANPQANKFVRMMILPNKTHLDLNEPLHRDVFMMAVAQHLGVRKVENLGIESTVNKLVNDINTNYPESFKVLHDWAIKNDGKAPNLTDEHLATFSKEFGDKFTPEAYHALLDFSRFVTHDQSKPFETSLYFESDGKTDGPGNSLVHFITGNVTPEWLEAAEKIGLFTDANGPKTIADNMQAGLGQFPSTDLYGVSSNRFASRFADRLNDEWDDPIVSQMRIYTAHALTDLLGDDFNFEQINYEAKIDAARNFTKNPMTVIGYGSGDHGIAGKIADEITRRFYKAISAKNVSERTITALKELTTRIAIVPEGKDPFVKDAESKGKNNPIQATKDFTFTPEQVRNIQENVKNLVVRDMRKAIEDTLPGIEDGRNALRDATQIQSIAAEAAIIQRTKLLNEQKKAEDPKWSQNIGLTQDEIDQIQKEEIDRYHLIYDSPTQSIFPAGSVNSDMADLNSPAEISAGLKGELRTTHRLDAPGNAGVKGLPYSIISGGDGQMVQTAFTGANRVKRAMPVFDGINLSLDRAFDDAKNINEAVFKSWMSAEPIGNANKAYQGFLETIKQNGLPSLSERQMADLNKVLLKDYKNVNTDPQKLVDAMIQHGEWLNKMALENRAIKNVLEQQIQIHVDHMAGLEQPHISEGPNRQKVTGNYSQRSREINRLIKAERDRLISKNEENSAKEPIKENISDDLNKIGRYDPEAKVRIINKSELEAANLNLSPELKTLYDHTLEHLEGRLIVGRNEDLASFLRDNPYSNIKGEEVKDLKKNTAWYDDETGDVYLSTDKGITGETITHELVHAATLRKAYLFYNDPSRLTDTERASFERINALREQWKKLDTSKLSPEELKSYNHLTKIMETLDKRGEQHSSLNEFMAYASTKQNLINIGKQSVVSERLAKITAAAVHLIKKVIFGNRPIGAPQNDIYSNLKFHIHVIAGNYGDPRPLDTMRMGIAAHQSEQFGWDERLTQVRKGFTRAISSVAARASTDTAKDTARKSADHAMAKALQLSKVISERAFPMTPQERSTFDMMVGAFLTESRLNPNSLARLHTLYTHVVKNLTVEHFMKDPESNRDPNDRAQAQEKLNAITGDLVTMTDAQKRSTLLPTFLALANVNEGFRDILSRMDRPKSEVSGRDGLDKVLEDAGIKAMDSLEILTSGDKVRQPHVRAAVDTLTHALTERAIDDQNFINNFSTKVGNAFDKGNNWIVDAMDRSSNWATDKLQAVEDNSDNKFVQATARVGQFITALGSETRSKDLQEGLMEMVNRSNGFKTLSELLGEFVGRTDSNGKVIDLIKLAKTTVSQLRQKFRDGVPRILRSAFSRKLTDEEKVHLHNILIKTDLMALHDRYSRDELHEILRDPKKLATEISKLETDLNGLRPEVADQMIKKAKELADYMNTGNVEKKGNLLRNAYAIAHLFGERGERNAKATSETIKLIDHLTSLHALDQADPISRKTISEMVDTEGKGLQLTMDYLTGQRKDELAKASATDYSMVNHYKGFVPIENKDGEAMIVADDRDMAHLLAMGYTRQGDYAGSYADLGPSKGYYYAAASGRSPFLEGIMQNVRGTAYGVDQRTGYSSGVMHAGRVDDIEDVRRIDKLRMLNNNSKNPMLPIYNGDGKVVAFERSVDPEMATKAKKPAEFDKAIGNWRGRQAEEAMAQEVNRKLVDALSQMWKKGRIKEKASYVNLLDPKEQMRDPIIADAARLLTPEAREYIKTVFGKNEFYVRRDLVNNAIGYRMPSVTDLWTGNTRISEPVRQAAVQAVTGIFGVKAYGYLRTVEHFVQDTISEAKATIIVRSVVVPMMNTIADVYQLASRGVPPAMIAKGYVQKAVEINSYLKSEARKQAIEAYMRGEQDPSKVRALRAEAKSIDDMQRHLSIWPLLESGQFSVVKALIGEDDSWKTMKSIDAMIERAIHKAPEPAQTALRYGVVSRDTALFKVMERATEYSDFIGRAVLYDHLVKKGEEPKKAVSQVTEEFVNYDYLPGRTRSYMESIGMTWFWNYKIRSAKIAMSIIRNNPLHMMLAGLAPHPHVLGTIGNPIRDNFFTMALNGRLKHSIGPMGMWEAAGSLNPWANIFGIWIPDL